MTPFERAIALHPSVDEFRDILEAHLLHGRIISTDRVFLMARPVVSIWPDDRLRNAWDVDEEGDCWHCWTLAGDIKTLKSIPHGWLQDRPWISFHRGDKPFLIPSSRILATK